jgi:signal transduction histidine kinase
VKTRTTESYRSWLIGELVLVAVLALGTVALAFTGRLDGYQLAYARISLDTAVALVASIVAILTATRFIVEGRGMDLLLTGGFVAIGVGTFAFAVAPVLSGASLGMTDGWAAIGASLFGTALISFAPFVDRKTGNRRRALVATVVLVSIALVAIWGDIRFLGLDLGWTAGPGGNRYPSVVSAYALLATLSLVAVVGFGLRYRRHGRDLDSWLTLALTLVLFADLHYVLAPLRSSEYVLPSDILRLFAFGVLLVGVWRAINQAEFGRAVAEERARVAREIHDGLAQYLFALSAHVSMLESGAELEKILPRVKHAVTAAQQEAQFAVLALSSASGSAPFDSALRRYVDLLVADGALDVELEVDPGVRLAPDEEIEVFRIVQEGLANVRKHAGAESAIVSIVNRGGRRIVSVTDDGTGIAGDDPGAGQGLKNMRARADSIQGVLSLRSTPGKGTSIEVVLRAA